MYKNKKFLSAVAAVAVLSSGAIAFDMDIYGNVWAIKGTTADSITLLGQIVDSDLIAQGVAKDTDGDGDADIYVYRNELDYNSEANIDHNGVPNKIVSGTLVKATYVGGVEANDNLSQTRSGLGDALIYPAFRWGKDVSTATSGWNTEITVTNTQNTAVIAKAVLYAADDTRELMDFNIYLSDHDMFKFTIDENGTVSTTDGSLASGINQSFTDQQVQFVKDGEKHIIGTLPEGVQSGYVIIYGMAQARTYSYHEDHAKLYEDYLLAMDLCRDTDTGGLSSNNYMTQWRRAYPTMVNGTFTISDGVGAPNVQATCMEKNGTNPTDPTYNPSFAAFLKARNATQLKDYFMSPVSNALFGSVRIYHEGDNRDLKLLATGLTNFTDDNITIDQTAAPRAGVLMLWAPGEYASIQDRRLQGTASYSTYDRAGLLNDANTFMVNNTYYTFSADPTMEQNNTMILTQVMKRALIEANNYNNYWSGVNNSDTPWGSFTLTYQLYDNKEQNYASTVGLISMTSPYNGSISQYKNELQTIKDLENENTNDYFANQTDGFAAIQFNGGTGIPAIVTQMSASEVGGETQINWVYSPVIRD